jgi:hypothetical protein
VTAKADTARHQLLWTHKTHPGGLTDEEAAQHARLSLDSEYSTRCSELTRMGCLTITSIARKGRAGTPRMVRVITPFGLDLLAQRSAHVVSR